MPATVGPCQKQPSAQIKDTIALFSKRYDHNPTTNAEITILILHHVVKHSPASNVSEILSSVQEAGRLLQAARPRDQIIGNVVRRVLRVVRDESLTCSTEISKLIEPEQGVGEHLPQSHQTTQSPASRPNFYDGLDTTPSASMFSLLGKDAGGRRAPNSAWACATSTPSVPSNSSTDIKAEICDALEEFVDELRQTEDLIAGYALDHVHSNDIILTNGMSSSVDKFLSKVASKRKFTLYQVVSIDTGKQGQHCRLPRRTSIRRSVSQANGMNVTIIPESAIFAIMGRVNQVILDAELITADGALIGRANTNLIVKAATFHKVPVVALAGVYKISPFRLHEISIVEQYHIDSKFSANYPNGISGQNNCVDDSVVSTSLELVITNLGGYAPSSMYRLISDHYKIEDLHI